MQQEQHQISELIKSHKSTSPLLEQGEKINALCNDIVESLAQHNTGLKTYNLVLEQKDVSINDTYFNDFFFFFSEAEDKLYALRKLSIKHKT